MATSGGANLRVRISADLDDIKKGLGLVRGDLAKIKRAGDNSAPSTDKWNTAIGSIRKQLAGIVTIYGSLRAVRWYTDQADQAANLAGRLRLATKSQQEFESAYRGTYQIAQQSSSEWEAIIGLYASLAQTTGMSQQGVLALTKVISQSFQVSGASAQEASNGLRQIQQALAGGTLRAEEFNTIIDTSPRIVQALADHFQISFGEVRKYVNDGKVSSREFAEAMLDASGDIQDDFDQLPVTVSRATQQVRNSLLAMVGDTDSATGASNDLATGILDLARTLESPEVMSGFRTFVGGVAGVIGALVKLMSTTANVTKFIGEELAARFSGPAADDTVRVEERIERLKRTMKAVQNSSSFNPIKQLDILNASELIPKDFVSKNETVLARLQGELDKENAKLEIGIKLRELAAQAQKKIGDTAAAAAPSVDELLEGMKSGGGGSSKGKAGSKTKDKIDQLTASTELLQDAAKRALDSLDKQFEDQKIGIADYYGKRVALQQQLIDLQIEQLQGELAVSKELDKRRNLEEQIIILQRDRQGIAVDAAREQEKAEKELNKTKLEGYRNQLSGLTGGLSAMEGSISAQMQAGSLGYVEGERRLQEVRKQTLEQLQALRAEQAAYVASLAPGDPNMAAAQEGLLGIDTAIANVTTSMQQMRQDTMDVGVSALGSFFSNLRDGAMSAAEAFRSLVADFAKGIYDMLAQATAKRLVSAVANLFGGGGKTEAQDTAQGAAKLTSAAAATTIAGGVIAFGASQLSNSAKELSSAASLLMIANSMSSFGAAHGGGRAGGLRLTRNDINPMVFGAAPRYHGGGIAGLQNDEIPAILQRGEIIRTRQQEAALQARMNSGQQSQVPIRNIIVFNEDELADALSGSAGEKVVINHVRRNGGGTGV